ncbi:MAG TPA: hypothetical protein VG942_16905 [Hyphomonadaceae bacterium]|nr:hypothetical protein [Hyphomonadaceae bacterium]
MRPRAGTEPITLSPSRIQEILGLSRQYDEQLKEVRQDLLRAETQLREERKAKWLIRAGCVGLGALLLASAEDPVLMTSLSDAFSKAIASFQTIDVRANTVIASLIVFCAVIWGGIWLVKRYLREPTPEESARKLMDQFAKRDGVAAYVFSGGEVDDVEQLAASTAMLTRKEAKTYRQRRLTPQMRPLASTMTALLSRNVDDKAREPYLH